MQLPFHVLALVTTYALSTISQTSAESSLVRATFAHERYHMESLEVKRSLRGQQTSPLKDDDERISLKDVVGKIKGIIRKIMPQRKGTLRKTKTYRSLPI
ncbi:hypothetical protein CCR75_005893 [Bremia lactucae]|uniref:RxLR effector protein n=1 Tax=Bremia lactucae TaxID=4779 RepID=A0A976FMI4_BRELC|nr:hypothetical protein CCR75_005893 [Bremia lactucae]